MKQYIIFDIDGTLNRTDLYAVEAYEKALEKRDLKVERKEIIACIGLSPAAIIEKLFGILKEDELKAWRADIERYEAVLMAERACTFEGIEETLTALKSAGYGLSICSNAYPDHINRVLSALRLTSYFDRIGSLAMGSNKTEIIRRMIDETGCSALMVGDRRFDVWAARNNHIPVIGCAYGYAPEEVRDADAIVWKPEEILDAVKRLL